MKTTVQYESVGLGSTEPCISTIMKNSDSIEKTSETQSSQSNTKRNARPTAVSEATIMLHGQIRILGTVPIAVTSMIPYATGNTTTGNDILNNYNRLQLQKVELQLNMS